jgi:hypothetical protein
MPPYFVDHALQMDLDQLAIFLGEEFKGGGNFFVDHGRAYHPKRFLIHQFENPFEHLQNKIG